MTPARTAHAVEMMTRSAERTGLTSDRPPRRHPWTDAFAVCTFIALERATADREYHHLALRLVHQVHHELGRHRNDDPRTGWIRRARSISSRGLPVARPYMSGLAN
jgi:hypothetical protein